MKFLDEVWADGGRVRLSFKSSSQGRNGVSAALRSGSLFFFKEKRLDQTGKDCLNIRFRYFLFYLP